MSEQTGLTVVALVVSFTALIISVGQLLQSIFGTAEGFRRTNKEIMGIFALSRDRVFHWAELRFETKFTTPHFAFHNVLNEESLLSRIDDRDHLGQKTSGSFNLAIANSANRFNDLNALIRSSTTISALQRFLNSLDPSYGPSHEQTLLSGSRAFSASWLTLFERLYEDEKKFTHRTDNISFIYNRTGAKGGSLGPDRRQILYPAIECHLRSWDLLPPDVVRPFASISFGDLLTLCFRLRLTVQDLRPGHFNADGYGNNLASLHIQGLGMIVQYRYDPSNDNIVHSKPGNTKFVPSDMADKLAFSIIPRHPVLGIHEDWHLGEWQSSENFADAMKPHFKDIGVSDETYCRLTKYKDADLKGAWRTLHDSLMLLAPFMPIDGLGIVKYQPPFPQGRLASMLWVREGRIILRHRMNEILPDMKEASSSHATMPPAAQSSASAQLRWVGLVLNFLERKYDAFHAQAGLVRLLDSNGYDANAHEYLREIRFASSEADRYLASLLNQPNRMPTYTHLVAAHLEMAITIHSDLDQQYRHHKENKDKNPLPHLRDGSNSPAVSRLSKPLLEAMHRYVDHVMVNRTLVDSYREKTREAMDPQGRKSATLSDEEIRAAWFTMMLRGCLWSNVHFGIWMPKLPYPSRYWKNNTLVLIS